MSLPQQWCPRPPATCLHLHRRNNPIHNRHLGRVPIRHGRLRIRCRDHHRPAGGTSPIHLVLPLLPPSRFSSSPTSNPNVHLSQTQKSCTRPTYALSPHPHPSQRACKILPRLCNSPTSAFHSPTTQRPTLSKSSRIKWPSYAMHSASRLTHLLLIHDLDRSTSCGWACPPCQRPRARVSVPSPSMVRYLRTRHTTKEEKN